MMNFADYSISEKIVVVVFPINSQEKGTNILDEKNWNDSCILELIFILKWKDLW